MLCCNLFLWATLGAPGWYEGEKPNILIILADDLGYGDLRANNPARGKIPTPCLDQLAAQGMRFTDAHSSSGVCSPTRYTLLTGRYHWRTRLQQGIVQVWGQPLIAPDRLTLAGLAKQQGYRTACIGKWHLGRDWPITVEQREHFPGLSGMSGGGGRAIAKVTSKQQETWKQVFSQAIPGGPTSRGFDEYFGTDVPNWPPYCFIENDRTVGIPSQFLPLEKLAGRQASLQGPALPNWKLENILPALIDRATATIQKQAKAKQPFLLYLPLTTPHTPLAVNETFKGKSGLDHPYADLVVETDAMVGKVLEALETAGVAQNTLVLFTSDNGCASYIGVKDLEAKGHFPSGPLRGYKTDVYEGGHRVPFLVRWPGNVKPGTVCNQLVHHADVMATMAEILGAKLPADAAEDSFSFLSLLRGQDKPVRSHAVSCASSGLPGLRVGAWKFIPSAKAELYNLELDLGENHNLAVENKERAASMAALLEKIISDGRSNTGPKQKNDVRVRRFPDEASNSAKKKKKEG
ncbi:MAG: arylsulfatase [Gemmataceae bacterium]|nr:arylsulfatase [Gemmataceae bacterium]